MCLKPNFGTFLIFKIFNSIFLIQFFSKVVKIFNLKIFFVFMTGLLSCRFLSEKERQAALLRLRQAQLRAAGEERYEAAMLVSGLADREAAAQERWVGGWNCLQGAGNKKVSLGCKKINRCQILKKKGCWSF